MNGTSSSDIKAVIHTQLTQRQKNFKANLSKHFESRSECVKDRVKKTF